MMACKEQDMAKEIGGLICEYRFQLLGGPLKAEPHPRAGISTQS